MLPRAVRSVLEQTPEAEVIVVDDGSSPDSAAEIRALYESDPRIRLIRNERSFGAPHGRNQGLELASGRYWATLDDDDTWLPGKWLEQRAILEADGLPDDLVVVTAVRPMYKGRPGTAYVPGVRRATRVRNLSELFEQVPPAAFLNSYVAPTTLMRSIGGYDERLVWGEHTDVLIRLARVARFAGTDRLGVDVNRDHELSGERVGRDWQRKVEGIRLLLHKHEAEFAAAPSVRAEYLHVLGISQLRLGDRWGAARTFARIVLGSPAVRRRLRALAALLITLAGGPSLWRRLSGIRGLPVERVV
jgi:glycosyltransferase involved in cell wall biosynthesis